MSICRRSWSPFRRHSVALLPHYVAPLPHSVAPFRHFALYPHTLKHRSRIFRRAMPTTFCRTTSAHFDAPNPHISLHRTTWYSCKTGFSYETGFSCKNGIQFEKRGVRWRNGVQLQSRGKSDEDTLMTSCWTPVLTSAVVRRPRQIA